MNFLLTVKSLIQEWFIQNTSLVKLDTGDFVSIFSSIIALSVSLIAIYISRQTIRTKCSIGYMTYKRDNSEWKDLDYGSFITIHNKSFYSVYIHDVRVFYWRKDNPGPLKDYADWDNSNIFLTRKKRLFYRACYLFYKILNISIHIDSLYDTVDDIEVQSMTTYRAQYDTALETTWDDLRRCKKSDSKENFKMVQRNYHSGKRRILSVFVILSNSKHLRMRMCKLPEFSRIVNLCAIRHIPINRKKGWPPIINNPQGE